jgi:hypothetical protein
VEGDVKMRRIVVGVAKRVADATIIAVKKAVDVMIIVAKSLKQHVRLLK